jgi:hypothetical protein
MGINLGTMSQLLTIRSKDVSSEGFTNWKFSSVHFWGENPKVNQNVKKISETKNTRNDFREHGSCMLWTG